MTTHCPNCHSENIDWQEKETDEVTKLTDHDGTCLACGTPLVGISAPGHPVRVLEALEPEPTDITTTEEAHA